MPSLSLDALSGLPPSVQQDDAGGLVLALPVLLASPGGAEVRRVTLDGAAVRGTPPLLEPGGGRQLDLALPLDCDDACGLAEGMRGVVVVDTAAGTARLRVPDEVLRNGRATLLTACGGLPGLDAAGVEAAVPVLEGGTGLLPAQVLNGSRVPISVLGVRFPDGLAGRVESTARLCRCRSRCRATSSGARSCPARNRPDGHWRSGSRSRSAPSRGADRGTSRSRSCCSTTTAVVGRARCRWQP